MSNAWPAWATPRVEISEPDPAWERHAAVLSADLERRLAPWLAGRVEHVGSTAVPGLAAKPIIDLMAPANSLTDLERADDALAEKGWHLVPPELDGRPWRRMHVLPDGDRRLAHLYLVEPDHPRWRDVLLFRDRLRLHPELVAEYLRIKRLAAQAHPEDREAYTSAKSFFVHQVVRPDTDRAAQPRWDDMHLTERAFLHEGSKKGGAEAPPLAYLTSLARGSFLGDPATGRQEPPERGHEQPNADQ